MEHFPKRARETLSPSEQALPPAIVEAESALRDVETALAALDALPVDVTAKQPIHDALIASREAHFAAVASWWHREAVQEHDTLTGAASLKEFNEFAAFELELSTHEPQQLGYILLDVNKFKDINDAFGHNAGDRYLQLIAQRCMASMREADLFARIGGDEFAAIVRLADDPASGLSRIGERLADAIRSAKEQLRAELRDDQRFQDVRADLAQAGRSVDGAITTWGSYASIGMTHGEPGDTIEAMKARADSAAYEAKNTGTTHEPVRKQSTTQKSEPLHATG